MPAVQYSHCAACPPIRRLERIGAIGRAQAIDGDDLLADHDLRRRQA